jgi:hypothetical protein
MCWLLTPSILIFGNIPKAVSKIRLDETNIQTGLVSGVGSPEVEP